MTSSAVVLENPIRADSRAERPGWTARGINPKGQRRAGYCGAAAAV